MRRPGGHARASTVRYRQLISEPRKRARAPRSPKRARAYLLRCWLRVRRRLILLSSTQDTPTAPPYAAASCCKWQPNCARIVDVRYAALHCAGERKACCWLVKVNLYTARRFMQFALAHLHQQQYVSNDLTCAFDTFRYRARALLCAALSNNSADDWLLEITARARARAH